jgi:beta-lactamase superfamily II metal-dependent hydrolase
VFELGLFPAREGDALILSWGDAAAPQRILIDAGRASTAKTIKAYARKRQLGPGAFELFVITHIDRDHIEGAVALLGDAWFRKRVKGVWFNGRKDLKYAPPAPGYETFGALQGEALTNLIQQHAVPWNTAFGDAPVAIVGGSLPVIEIGGLKLTIVSPDLKQLAALAHPWDEQVSEKAPSGWETYGEEAIDIGALAKTPFRPDRAKPNGSSIAMIAEYGARRILLTGDAHVARLRASLDQYANRQPGLRHMCLVKASHHGSRGNTSLELVSELVCPHWVISTNGDHFGHPDQEAIARILAASPPPVCLFFNYATDRTRAWAATALTPNTIYQASFGEDGLLSIDLAALPNCCV